MSTKYSEVMNTSGLNGKLFRMDVELHEKLYNLEAVVTEKIHGENCRVGIDEDGEFIGQKNNHFREFEKHPNWNKFSEKTKNEIKVIHTYIRKMKTKYKQYKQKDVIFFGELYGKGMQSGFEWDFADGLRILWFDVKVHDQYIDHKSKQDLFQMLQLNSVPVIGEMTIKEALDLDIENIKSKASLSDYIEGVVITPLEIPDWWRFPARLILKYKTEKYSEQKQRHKKEKPINNFVSKYVDFVTEARIDHVIQSLKESGTYIRYEMCDLQHIPRAMITDIEKEENDGQSLAKEDRKYLGSYIPKFYKKYLDQMLKDMIIERDRVKNG